MQWPHFSNKPFNLIHHVLQTFIFFNSSVSASSAKYWDFLLHFLRSLHNFSQVGWEASVNICHSIYFSRIPICVLAIQLKQSSVLVLKSFQFSFGCIEIAVLLEGKPLFFGSVECPRI